MKSNMLLLHSPWTTRVWAALLLLGLSACDPTVQGTATLDGHKRDLVDVRGSVTTDGSAIVYELTGWSNPSCSIADDEVSVSIQLRVTDVAAVPLATPIDISAPGAPVEVSLAMGAMGSPCADVDCVDPAYTLSGSVTIQSLSVDEARGSLDVTLTGDVPLSGQPDRIYKRDAVLHVDWSGWKIPDEIDHCD